MFEPIIFFIVERDSPRTRESIYHQPSPLLITHLQSSVYRHRQSWSEAIYLSASIDRDTFEPTQRARPPD